MLLTVVGRISQVVTGPPSLWIVQSHDPDANTDTLTYFIMMSLRLQWQFQWWWQFHEGLCLWYWPDNKDFGYHFILPLWDFLIRTPEYSNDEIWLWIFSRFLQLILYIYQWFFGQYKHKLKIQICLSVIHFLSVSSLSSHRMNQWTSGTFSDVSVICWHVKYLEMLVIS